MKMEYKTLDLTNERLIELNSLTKYPKLYTLFNRDNKFKIIKGVFNERLKGIKNVKEFIITEKIDGTNCGIVLIPTEKGFPDVEGVYIRKRSTIINNDKDHKLYFEATKGIDMKKVIDYFNGSKSLVILFGEACGGTIQKQAKVYSDKPTFRLFDIKCGNSYFDWRNILDFSKETGIKTVDWEHTKGNIFEYDELLKYLINKNKKRYFEGIVVRSEPPMLNQFGMRMMFKVKLKDFTK